MSGGQDHQGPRPEVVREWANSYQAMLAHLERFEVVDGEAAAAELKAAAEVACDLPMAVLATRSLETVRDDPKMGRVSDLLAVLTQLKAGEWPQVISQIGQLLVISHVDEGTRRHLISAADRALDLGSDLDGGLDVLVAMESLRDETCKLEERYDLRVAYWGGLRSTENKRVLKEALATGVAAVVIAGVAATLIASAPVAAVAAAAGTAAAGCVVVMHRLLPRRRN